ncbi:transporter substrate-binding domain-containing protein [Kingella kingae]|uniref:transporter substrate-binding domain-containing protein n=1 Tax=Kingella kingae TaxID=504 RepID=UPI001E2FD0E5|nr:transporter substrate-binding domain-containing protein [Kingella kingae]MDK4575503.1 transporter substrate-binding domain-containing protein [Kingella kingae]MDK4607616.1 transporter substrate-binding domain-containing protein [Kingella kingae]
MKMKYISVLFASMLALSACQNESTQQNIVAPSSSDSSPSAASTKPTSGGVDFTVTNPSWQTYLVGSEFGYMPFEFSGDKGQPNGFEMELLHAVAKAGEFNVQVVNAPFNTVESTLNNGKFHMWASGLGIVPERADKMLMSEPFLDFQPAIMILDTPENQAIQKPEDLAGKTIAVNKGGLDNIAIIEGLKGKAVLSDSFYLSLKEMYVGNTVAVVGNSRIFQYYKKERADIAMRIIPIGEEKQYFGFAVKKGNTELMDKINRGLAKAKADGTLDALTKKWFE